MSERTLRDFFVNKFISGSMMGAGMSAIAIHYSGIGSLFLFATLCFIFSFIMFMFAKH